MHIYKETINNFRLLSNVELALESDDGFVIANPNMIDKQLAR